MSSCEIDDEEIKKVVKEYFTQEEWENLADNFKIDYCNMYRNYLSVQDAENVIPLPEFMRKSEENQKVEIIQSCTTSKESKSVPITGETTAAGPSHVRRNPKRNVSKRNYYEMEEARDDRYVYCDNCNEAYVDFCSKCGMLVSLKDYPVPNGTEDRARKTVPKEVLEIRPSQIHGLGVFAVRNLRRGVQMGPYEGQINKVSSTAGYSWSLRGGKLIDAGDETNSNWLRYVNCARNVAEQNVTAFQHKGNLYYRTCKEVKRGDELLVYYGHSFAKFLGIDTKKYFEPDKEQVNLKYFEPYEEEVNLKYFTCEYCFVGLSTSKYRDSHQIHCKFRPIRKNVHSNEENLTCQYCHCALITTEVLKKHEQFCSRKRKRIENNSAEKKQQCPYCEYKTTKKSVLNRHIVAIHEKENCPKFHCQACSFETIYKHHLRNHIKIHTGYAPFKCTDCPERLFTAKRDLDSHLLSRHQNLRHLVTSKIHRCTLCTYETVFTSCLKNHVIMKHTKDTAERYHCHICEYSTLTKWRFTSHIAAHTNPKPFVCKECSKYHNRKRDLDNHVIRYHPLNTELMRTITNKIHSCQSCSYQTIIQNNFHRHVKTHNK